MLAGVGAVKAHEALAAAGGPRDARSGGAAAPGADTDTSATSITYDAKLKVFHLRTPGTSYIIQVVRNGMLAHVYWGRRLQSASWPGMRNGHEDAAPPTRADLNDRDYSPNTQLQ
jgi:alpha-galactosidase